MTGDARPYNMGAVILSNLLSARSLLSHREMLRATGHVRMVSSYQPTTEHFFLQRDWSAGLVRTVNGYNLPKCYRMITLYPFRFLVVGQIFGEISLGQNCSAAE